MMIPIRMIPGRGRFEKLVFEIKCGPQTDIKKVNIHTSHRRSLGGAFFLIRDSDQDFHCDIYASRSDMVFRHALRVVLKQWKQYYVLLLDAVRNC